VGDEANQLWDKVLEALRGRVGEQMIDKLLRPLEALDAADGVLLLRAPNDFAREWVTKGYVPVIEESLKYFTGKTWSVHWAASAKTGASTAPRSAPKPPPPLPRPQVDPKAAPKAAAPAPAKPAPQQAPAPSAPARTMAPPVSTKPAAHVTNPGAASGSAGCGLSPKYTFDTFVNGPSNNVAHAMAMAMANLAGRRVNVLFLCGGTGLGKTHLSNAIGHRILEQKPGARIVYVSAETFTNEYVAAIQQKRMEEFRGRYRTECDGLLIDDVQFLAGREGTQEEFFHTFNALYQKDIPIVLTSDVLPQNLHGMAERLMSRFASGLVAEVYPPELETRIAILRKKAEQDGVKLDDETAALIASAGSNVRELEGMLMKLSIRASLSGRGVIDAALARETLRIGSKPAVTTVEDVQRAVCDHYRIKLNQLTGKDRHKEVALPRQVAMYLARTHLGTSFPQIGARFNGKDHTTVMSSVRKVAKLRVEDAEVAAALEAISLKLGFPGPVLDAAAGAEEYAAR
jgi:chromosomal replication initiator protein